MFIIFFCINMNLDYYNIINSNLSYFIDEIVIFTNMYKIIDHPLRKNIKSIEIYDDFNNKYEYDIVDNLIFISNDDNKRLFIKITSNKI